MRNESIVFKGINRHSFDNGTANGYCEELINVRSEDGQMKVVNPKAILSSVYYDDIIEHVYPAGKNYIGHKIASGYHVFEKFDISGTSSPVQINGSISSTHEVYYTCVNNFFVISDKTDIKTYIFIYDEKGNSGYSSFYSGFESINVVANYQNVYPSASTEDVRYEIDVKELYNTDEYIQISGFDFSKLYKAKTKDTISSSINRVIDDDNGKYAEGYIITCVTATLWDNSEIMLTDFVSHRLDTAEIQQSLWPNISEYILTIDGLVAFPLERISKFISITRKKYFGGMDFFFDAIDLSQYKDVIRKVNLYCSKPLSRIDLNQELVKLPTPQYEPGSVDDLRLFYAKERILEDGEIDYQKLYHQKSWNIDNLPTSSNKYSMYFGTRQTVGNMLNVTSNVNRAGRIFNYNKRLHFFGTKAKVSFENSYISDQTIGGTGTSAITCDVYVFLRIEGVIRVVKHSNVSINTTVLTQDYAINFRPMFTYPDSRAYRIVFKYGSSVVDMQLDSSRAYNYSYSYVKTPEFATKPSVISELSEYANCTTTIEYDEDTAINVTSQGNPIFFPVENSYSVDHRIVDLSIAFEEISAVQTGQYPVYIFTEKGIFALAQGVGDVLYSSVVPVNADEVTGNVKQTRYGMVYISGGRIMLLSGRQSKCLSEYIDGEPDIDIRGLSGSSFNQCCCNNNLYNISQYLSKYPTGVSSNYLREFLSNAIINWSSSEDELIISSNGYDYSYVLNMTRNTWYKISSSYLKSSIPNIMLMKSSGATRSIVDYGIPSDNDATIHIQTRPIMLSPNQYTTVLRSILNAKAELSQSQLLSVYIFASDNCFDWTCVAGAQKKGCTTKSIRLNRVNKSYRYHAIIIGGKVAKDTEITNMVMTIDEKMNNKLR